MDKLERAQIRLLLEHLGSEYRAQADERQKAMHADHAALGTLQSDATVKSALRIAEDLATDYVKTIVAAVADVAHDSDAFSMTLTDVTIMLCALQVGVDQAVKLASGRGEGANNYPSVSRETNRLFLQLQQRTLRLFEIHRFSFTRPSPARVAELRRPVLNQFQEQPSKNKGGKPLAGHGMKCGRPLRCSFMSAISSQGLRPILNGRCWAGSWTVTLRLAKRQFENVPANLLSQQLRALSWAPISRLPIFATLASAFHP